MAKKHSNEGIFGLILAAVALLILWLMNRNGMLHTSVTSVIGGNSSLPVIDADIANGIAAGLIRANGTSASGTCPAGFVKYQGAGSAGGFWCVSQSDVTVYRGD